MSTMWKRGCCWLVGSMWLVAAAADGLTAQGVSPAVERRGAEVDATEEEGTVAGASSKRKLSSEARAALRAARALEQRARGQRGAERKHRLEVAAEAFDRCVAQFDGEPFTVALAAWSGAQVWRRQGSLLLAEKGYLLAARSDPGRYQQRGLLGAADMQRRQQRVEEALENYARAERADASTSYAQQARLWIARLIQARGAIDEAIERFQAALESAPSPRQAIDAADLLAKAWIAKGDLDAAGFVIDHAEQLVLEHSDDEPDVAEWLRRALQRMPARRALQRARDEARDAGGDAVRLDEHLRKKLDESGPPSQPGC